MTRQRRQNREKGPGLTNEKQSCHRKSGNIDEGSLGSRRRRRSSHQRDQRPLHHNGGQSSMLTTPTPPSASSSIEEDLKQQRIRQRERQRQREEEDEQQQERHLQQQTEDEDEQQQDAEAVVDGGHIHGDNSNSFGFQRVRRNTSLVNMLMGNNHHNLFSSYDRKIPSQIIGYMQEINVVRHTKQRQLQLRDRQYCSYIVENMMINSKASTLFDPRIRWHAHPLSDGRVTNTMFTCKDRLHPQARTFDVAFPDSDQGAMITSSSSPNLPTVSTIIQGGWGMFRPKCGPADQNGVSRNLTGGGFNTFRCPPVHSIRIHEPAERMGAIVRASDRHMPYTFHIYPIQHATTSYVEATLPQAANDFCFGRDIALFACPRFRSAGVLGPIFLHLEHGTMSSPFRRLDVRNFPQSDALRVEMKCKNNDKFIAFGHRNGQVSLIDLRAPQAVCSILQCEASASSCSSGGRSSPTASSLQPLGSVSDLAFLGDHGMDDKLLLVKRSFGSSQLHDLRVSSVSTGKSESVFSPPHGLSSSKTLVQNFALPSDQINATLSLNCNGLAVDGIAHTMFSPYIQSNGDACVGIWSLRSGALVESRLLISDNGIGGSNGDDVVFVEMSQRLTPSYVSKKHDSYKAKAGCGLWLKCGTFTNTNNASSKAGNLFHISVPGRWSP